MIRRLHRLLAGEDGPGKRALPAGELLHPAPMAALAVLLVNDHWLKGAELLPGLVTGKLSDLAGLLLFPLLLTASADVLLLAAARWMGAGLDFSLRRWKLALACGLTAALFCAIKLSPWASEAVSSVLVALGFRSRIVVDPSDLLTVPVIALAYWLGIREIARVPLGRLEVIERRWRRGQRDSSCDFEDAARAGASRQRTDELARGFACYLQSGDATEATEALKSIRASKAARACPRSSEPSDQRQTEHQRVD